ncbi:MAG: hypothetical protein MJ156_02680 [Alphaproteobacteria bacterium]|nr:hypothetical protein [Alphaproteobacteria bacterium]
MPDITLNIPTNSRFSSSLNEIDCCMKEIFLKEMLIADPRDKSHKQNSLGQGNSFLWESDRVFQVDDMTTEDIFDTWLLRHSQTNKNLDVTYPLLAYKQNDIKDVFWGTGNRYRQWEITVPQANSDIEVGDVIVIKDRSNKILFGTRAIVLEIKDNQYVLAYENTGTKIKDAQGKVILFSRDVLGQLGNKLPITYKAKAITGSYSAVVLVDNRDEAQYIRDHLILRCNDANIWFTYASPTIANTENQIYTVFDIPTLERYPTSTERVKGKGYVYGVGWDVNIWAALTDTPMPAEIIEMIRMNLKLKNEERYQKIIITK